MTARAKTSWPASAAAFLFATSACVAPAGGAAQSRRESKRTGPPRVGTIKDYPATGLATGCGNLYFNHANRAGAADSYVFLARSEGLDAWMNLDGRDVRLVLVKATSMYKAERVTHSRFEYRAGGARITVVITPVDKSDAHMFEMTITLRQGGAARTVRAVGHSDC